MWERGGKLRTGKRLSSPFPTCSYRSTSVLPSAFKETRETETYAKLAHSPRPAPLCFGSL